VHLELVFLDADRRTGPRPLDLTPIKTVHPIGSSNATLHRPNDSRGSAHQSSSGDLQVLPRICVLLVQVEGSIGRDGRGHGRHRL